MATAIEQPQVQKFFPKKYALHFLKRGKLNWQKHVKKSSADLREEFANRYDADKEQMVEALDAMLTDTITKELKEFAEDKRDAVATKVDYHQK